MKKSMLRNSPIEVRMPASPPDSRFVEAFDKSVTDGNTLSSKSTPKLIKISPTPLNVRDTSYTQKTDDFLTNNIQEPKLEYHNNYNTIAERGFVDVDSDNSTTYSLKALSHFHDSKQKRGNSNSTKEDSVFHSETESTELYRPVSLIQQQHDFQKIRATSNTNISNKPIKINKQTSKSTYYETMPSFETLDVSMDADEHFDDVETLRSAYFDLKDKFRKLHHEKQMTDQLKSEQSIENTCYKCLELTKQLKTEREQHRRTQV